MSAESADGNNAELASLINGNDDFMTQTAEIVSWRDNKLLGGLSEDIIDAVAPLLQERAFAKGALHGGLVCSDVDHARRVIYPDQLIEISTEMEIL